uniref:Arachidonate 15-lipoxygenase B-like n=1 Tax=Echeneis naucrates TaxID=173247 RepID=A0A665UP70_ECHNA
MVTYKVTVSTGNILNATTFSSVSIKLVGTDGESERTWLLSFKWLISFLRGAVSSFNVYCPTSLGKLVLIELDKQHLPFFPEDSWFPAKVEVKAPEGDTYHFPIYRWITDNEVNRFREGTDLLLKRQDKKGKNSKCQLYIKQVLTHEFTSSLLFPEYVQKHWKEDALFASQFLNGVNPMMIRRCTVLPENFPVTDAMVFLHGQGSLKEEMKKGNIFLCDYQSLDGLEANTINGKKQYLMAPLVLFHKTPEDKLMPIAIQLKQTPADDNPIFFPTDSEYDWLMAKIFVRSADFIEHQLNTHLLRTHLLAEVFAVSLLRNLPMVHPLYKLLVPHTRYTLQINVLARNRLISEGGIFSQFTSCGKSMITVLQRSLASVTYSSLCIPDNIAERGLQDVPNFYYRDDGLRLWSIINKFVKGVLNYYYDTDAEVQKDSELQKWIQDIFEHGFLSQTGIPQRFTTVAELIKFVTMVIFTCSAQHSAVNTGQYDYCGWMPNTPSTLQLPPPTTKGTTDETTMLHTLPDVNTTVQSMASLWLLSKSSSDFVAFGQYPEEHFIEEVICQLIKDFQRRLALLSATIKIRNQTLEIPYTYMDPAEFENSVAI